MSEVDTPYWAEETRLLRSVDAVDRTKREQGVTWYGYVAEVIEQTEQLSVSLQVEEKLNDLREWLPEIRRAEKFSDVGCSQAAFESLKIVVARDIGGVMATLRDEMFTDCEQT